MADKKNPDDLLPPSDEQDEGELHTFDGDGSDDDVEDTEDGGAIVTLGGGEADNKQRQAHFANIVTEVDQGELKSAVNDLLDLIERDKEAREKRDKLYEEGLRRTGLGDDAPGGAQFTGANKVVHPMLVEACVDFSARVMKEIFPPGGPVKSKIMGVRDKVKIEKAERKAEFMNWQTTEQMVEFRGELEQLSTQLPLGGAQYLKLMWNPQHRRPLSEFIAIDDILLPYAATNFYSAERKTHVQYITEAEYNRRVKAGMYADVEVGAPDTPEPSKAARANEKIEGKTESSYNEDGLRTVFEVYVHLDFDEDMSPYILSIDKSSGKALGLYRNWEKDDEQHSELDWIVEFPFVPWRGAYPIGLTHMIGSLSGAATGALRALLDSAFIQNSATMLKLKGGPPGQTLNLQPTQVTEIEGGALVDDIRKLAMPIPFPGPSQTLFQLLGFVVDAGKGVVQTSFEKLSDANAQQPVGTTMALIEQGMVVFSSIHSRLHNSLSRVLKIIHRINSAYLSEDDIKAQSAGMEISPADFDGPMDVIPVSDPAIFSETQRFAQTQAVMQRADAKPQMYDPRKVEEMFLRNLKLDADDVLQPAPASEDIDPVSENVAATMSQPLYVLPHQDHMAHLKTHLAFLKSPLFGQNPVIIRTFLYPMAQHLRDHLLNYYLTEAHEAVDQAQKQHLIEEDADQQVKVILQVQQVIEQQLAAFAQELAQIDQAAQQYKPQPPMPPDSSLQVARMGLQANQAQLAQKAEADKASLALKAQEQQRKAAADQQDAELKKAELDRKAAADQQALLESQNSEQAQTGRVNIETQARVGMNDADNRTALEIAAAELQTGEKIAVSTGTGVNPGG